ncbi:hypothetical protein Xmau_03225 [Xenorhabdus mauleonii]|uniref:Uncharacterized protein n=1 Tax=Xenorhabdus mauleonii TaxID=351675 RepID=A0A1I3WJI1_9GAMM|nr:hypothetical protein Xmau_03225 [Xenorhabdus mauleonii]SFK07612.1 hypothetical protein SAMN05421680_12721 [Xenorhabdus mauleonii]
MLRSNDFLAVLTLSDIYPNKPATLTHQVKLTGLDLWDNIQGQLPFKIMFYLIESMR